MIRSMTAFATAETELDGWLLAWELRSVNHRYLDASLRLPEAFRSLEPEARVRVGAVIKRGRVDGTFVFKRLDHEIPAIRLNQALVGQLVAAARTVEAVSDRPLANFHAFEILNWPGVLQEMEPDRERLGAGALDLLSEALTRLVAGREAEGHQLGELLAERCAKLRELTAGVRDRQPEVLKAIRQRIMVRLKEIAATPDPDRLEQELVYLAQKLDVAEELDRLDAHVEDVLRALRDIEPTGRRLDFLLQEMHREANTLGAKSADIETTRAAVEMKVLIEQMREQAQNIE
ncbi:conserved protein of unknown function [Candidatus Methylocalor cossyra]|uniref:YicC family protein n=2 Tax=Candidatus Methylocalor cossyra TaxID=3108543 RepID=A0ABM9NI88_9GAMM